MSGSNFYKEKNSTLRKIPSMSLRYSSSDDEEYNYEAYTPEIETDSFGDEDEIEEFSSKVPLPQLEQTSRPRKRPKTPEGISKSCGNEKEKLPSWTQFLPEKELVENSMFVPRSKPHRPNISSTTTTSTSTLRTRIPTIASLLDDSSDPEFMETSTRKDLVPSPEKRAQNNVINLVSPSPKRELKRFNHPRKAISPPEDTKNVNSDKPTLTFSDQLLKKRSKIHGKSVRELSSNAPQLPSTTPSRSSYVDTDEMIAYQIHLQERAFKQQLHHKNSDRPRNRDEDFARTLQEEEYRKGRHSRFVAPPMMRQHTHPGAYGAGRGNALPVLLSMLGRDFNENDYELLLKLDENIVSKKGAAEEKIDALPLRVIQPGETIQSCCICLSDMEEGVTVRSLPCMHHFHIECIDNWLKVNRSCPIDKKEID